MGYEADQEAVDAAVAAERQQSIKIKSKSREERERRYDRRQWARQGQENLEKWKSGKYYDEPEPVKQPKSVKVTRQEPEKIEKKTVKIQKKGMNEAAARYAQRKADRAMREAKESTKVATKKLGEKLKGMKQEKVEKVEDEKTVEKVDTALKNKKYPPTIKTRSQELSEIKDRAYNKQRGIEDKKKITKENKAADRAGKRAGMTFIDRQLDRIRGAREQVEEVEDKIDEVKEAVRPGSTKAKPKVKKATVKPVKLTAAQKKRIDQQMARSQKALSPKPRTPFGTRTKALTGPTTQKSMGRLNKPRTSGLNKPRTNANGLNAPRSGNPFSTSHTGNPFGSSKSGNPFGTRHTGNPFSATSRTNPNPIGWSPRKITRL